MWSNRSEEKYEIVLDKKQGYTSRQIKRLLIMSVLLSLFFWETIKNQSIKITIILGKSVKISQKQINFK